MAARGETRQKMLVATIEVMRERGAAGVTVDEVLARSGAPRGAFHRPLVPGGRGTTRVGVQSLLVGPTDRGRRHRLTERQSAHIVEPTARVIAVQGEADLTELPAELRNPDAAVHRGGPAGLP